ncbi:unnamed protein product [Sphagnum balticum]
MLLTAIRLALESDCKDGDGGAHTDIVMTLENLLRENQNPYASEELKQTVELSSLILANESWLMDSVPWSFMVSYSCALCSPTLSKCQDYVFLEELSGSIESCTSEKCAIASELTYHNGIVL